ncbi:MAG: hypothetical protein KBD17_00920 [Candidatus Pacebacteria bacterium]|nr:hypothetical protein [Candidatus Paceibacterota bacterium]
MSAPAAAPAATAAAPTAKHNPNWIRDVVTSFLLAIALRAGFEIPFISAFLAIVIVFLTQVLLTDLKVGFQASAKGLKFTARVIAGVVIFITIRYLLAEVVGFYPVDSKNLLGPAGGLQGLMGSRGISKVLMFEIVYAFVAGKLVANWVSEKDGGAVKLIFTTAFCFLFLQFVVPTYTNSFPSWGQVGQKLVDRGLVGSAWDGAWTLAFGKSATPAAQNSNTQPDPQPTPKADFTFLFEKDDCVTLRLGKVRWEPINHSLKVQDPSGQWILEKRGDEPVKRYFDSGEKWTFCKGDPNETGVHFWGEVFTSR